MRASVIILHKSAHLLPKAQDRAAAPNMFISGPAKLCRIKGFEKLVSLRCLRVGI